MNQKLRSHGTLAQSADDLFKAKTIISQLEIGLLKNEGTAETLILEFSSKARKELKWNNDGAPSVKETLRLAFSCSAMVRICMISQAVKIVCIMNKFYRMP